MFGLKRSGCVLAMVLGAATPVLAQQATPAGHIKTSSGTAYIVRNNATVAAKPGAAVFETDSLRTGADGSVGITLKDDTRLSLGPDHRRLLPASMMGGAALTLACDVATRLLPGGPRLGVVTALVGGPFFLWMLRTLA